MLIKQIGYDTAKLEKIEITDKGIRYHYDGHYVESEDKREFKRVLEILDVKKV